MDRLKKFKKLWLTFLLGAIASCALALVAACGGGGEKVSLFLDAGEGGSLSETEYELEAGARLSDFLKDIDVTTQAGVTFDGWYRADSNVRVGEGDTMPESALTLKARYTVSYTVNFWVQNASGAFDRGDTATGTGFYLESCTPDVEVPQHYLVDGARSKTTVDRLNLNETFEIYLARRTYYVSYDANGLENAGSMPAGEGLYESSVPVSDCGFNVPEDHRFLGWSSSENGEIDYLPGDNIPSISSNLRLFAVWDVALRNRYSGSDLLFLPKLEEGKAILVRGGYDFEGEYDAEEGTFTVTVGGNVLEGKVFGNVYAYAERDLAGSYFYLDPYLPADFFSSPDPDERLDETIVLKIDEFGSAEYTHPAVEAVEAGTAQGYVRRTDGVYYFASDDGLFAFYFYLDTYTAADGVSRPVFCANSGYNESGTFYQFVTVDGGSGWEGSGMLELDGFGGLAYLDGDLRYYVGSYVPVQAYENAGNFIIKMEGVIYATDANEEPTGDAMRFPFYLTPLASGEYGFVIPNYLYGTFSNGEGETFVLDGFGSFPDSLTYTDGEGHTWQGAYTLYATSRYGTAIAAQLSSEGGVAQEFFFRFVFGSGANDVTIEAIRPEGAEYLELRDGGFYAPALVLLDEEYTDADNKTLGRKAELWLPESGGSVLCRRMAGRGKVRGDPDRGGGDLHLPSQRRAR